MKLLKSKLFIFILSIFLILFLLFSKDIIFDFGNKYVNSLSNEIHFELIFNEEDLLDQELSLLHNDDIKEILGYRYINGIKQTFYIPNDIQDEDIALNTFSYITVDDKNYYLGASLEKYSEEGFQWFHLIKSHIGDKIFEFRKVIGANNIVTEYIHIEHDKPRMITSLNGDIFSKDIDGDGIIESIGTIGTAPETTIYNWDLNNNKIYFTNLNEATDSLAVLYEGNDNQFKVFKNDLELVYEYKEKNLYLID